MAPRKGWRKRAHSCKRGHRYQDGNFQWIRTKNGRGEWHWKRNCMICVRIWNKRRWRRKHPLQARPITESNLGIWGATYIGKLCPKCKRSLRYWRNHVCVYCTRAQKKARYHADTEHRKAVLARKKAKRDAQAQRLEVAE